MTNQEIARLFRNVAAAYSIKDSKKYYFQITAYEKAAESIESSTTEIKDLYKESKLQTVPSIGTTMKSRLEELFRTGSVAHYKLVMKGIPEAVFALIRIPTIGPKKAYKLASVLGLKNTKTAIDELESKAKNHEVAKIPTFGDKSEQDILRAIAEFRLGKGKTARMMLPFASEIAEKILTFLRQSSAVIKAVPLGSLRRMMPTVGDIDIAISTNNPHDAIEKFVSYPYKERIIEKGTATASILTSGGKQIDLMAEPPEAFGALLQHFTGSKDHNIRLREHALKQGLSLSEKGIKDLKTGKTTNYDSEEKFYNAIGLDLVPPELRENRGEIELAAKHQLPKLVEQKDIKGDLHIHSNFPIEPSHDSGQTKMKQIIEYAEKLKYEYIGFSEHNPSASGHSHEDVYNIISKRNEAIEHIKSDIKSVRVFKLLEVDILASGKLAADDKSLELLDAAIVSIHSSFSMNKDEMTKRILNGLSHPKAKILAHPTGRKFNEREGYDVDFDKIFDYCRTRNKAIEINSWPNRLDLPDQLVKEAIECGVKLIINTDSHEVSQMNLMRYGIAMARRGWSTKNDIINTLNYEYFSEWLTQQ